MITMVIIYNGKKISSHQACIHHNDRGFTLGHGLFETILIKNGMAPALDYHWHRLEKSAQLISITLPFSKQELTEMLWLLINENELQHKTAGVRITVTHGESARGIWPSEPLYANYVITVFEHTHTLKLDFSVLITTIRKNEHSTAARIKSISYLDNILAKQEAISQGYDEAILLNTASKIADGAITNLFVVKKNRIHTPPIADGALPGVVRSILLNELNFKFPIIEKSLSLKELLNADEAFLTNALMGIQPISQINDIQLPTVSTGLAIAAQLRTVKDYI